MRPAPPAQLEAQDPQHVFSGKAVREPISTVFLFPGGGAQYAGMGAELYEKEPVYRDNSGRLPCHSSATAQG